MRKILTVTLVAALALFAGSAYANFCARDVVPATTLLVPYVVVGMNGATPDPNGYTTLLSVTNTSSDATIIHIVVWNAESEGVLDFDEALSGYDVWTINFGDLLSGHWSAFQTSLDILAYQNTEQPPLTRGPFEWGPDGRSAFGDAVAPFDGRAPLYNSRGVLIGYTEGFPTGLPTPESTNALPGDGCNMDQLNDATGAQFAPVVLDGLMAPLFARSHEGCTYWTNTLDQVVTRHTNDWLSTLSDNPVFFYVTVDVFERCDLIFPFDPGYFDGGRMKFENVLIGEYYYLNLGQNYSEGFTAVHIESDIHETLDVGFYGEAAYDPDTHLEPLATAFGFRYYNDAPAVTSSVLLWKNYTEFYPWITPSTSPWVYLRRMVIDCGSYLYYAWDQDEHCITRGVVCPVSPCAGADIDPNEFPFETQEVPLTSANFDLPDKYGWILLVFPPSYDVPFDDQTPSGINNLIDNWLLWRDYQAWAGIRVMYQGYSAGLEAATMANAHCFPTQILPQLGINYDYIPAGI